MLRPRAIAMTEPASDSVATLRARLQTLRADLRQRLAVAEVLDAGLLQVLADVETVIATLDSDGATT
jgi:hypothetical protein